MAGFDIVYGLDNNAAAVATFQHNHPDAKAIKADATALDSAGIPDFDILVGGPPCVNFSSSKGSRANVLEGLRLVQASLRVVYERNPRYWIMENVPRIALHLPDAIPLSWIGIDKPGVLPVPVRQEFNCADYGVPQLRRRYLIGNYPVPEPDCSGTSQETLFNWSSGLKPWRTLGDILQALPNPELRPRGAVTDPNYGFPLDGRELADHFHHVRLSEEESERIRKSKTRTVVATQLGRETLVIRGSTGTGYRRATVRECATLQTFPISFHFCGNSLGSRYRQAGDAVPPRLSLSIARAVLLKEGFGGVSALKLNRALEAPPPAISSAKRPGLTVFPPDKRFKEVVPGKEIRGCRIEFDNQGDAPTRARFCREDCLNVVQWVARLHLGEGKNTRLEKILGLSDCLAIFAKFCAHTDSGTREKCMRFADDVFSCLAGKVPDATTLQAIYTRRVEGVWGPGALVKLLKAKVDAFFPKATFGSRRIPWDSDLPQAPKKGLLLRIAAGALATAILAELSNCDTRWLGKNRSGRFFSPLWEKSGLHCADESPPMGNPVEILRAAIREEHERAAASRTTELIGA